MLESYFGTVYPSTMSAGSLHGVQVIVAGAGLAGLSAARELEARGATTTVIEARDRVGGRVWTIRDGFAGRQHAEAGADFIEDHQDQVRQLARDLGLAPIRILRDGFGFYGPDARGRRRIQATPGGFRAVGRLLHTEIADFKLAESTLGQRYCRRVLRDSQLRPGWTHETRRRRSAQACGHSAASFWRIRKICRCCH